MKTDPCNRCATPDMPDLVEDQLYDVDTQNESGIQATWSPIDGIRANHPWLGTDGTRYREDYVIRARPVLTDPAPSPEPAEHHVTIDYGHDGYAPTTRLTCTAPEESLCRAVYGCGCEEYYDPRIDSGVASHANGEGERHYGVFSDCQLIDWFDNSDEVMRGAVTVPVRVEWNDGPEFVLGGDQ